MIGAALAVFGGALCLFALYGLMKERHEARMRRRGLK